MIGGSLQDSSSSPTPKPSLSPSTYADIGGSKTTLEALDIGENNGIYMESITKLIPLVHGVPTKKHKVAKKKDLGVFFCMLD